MECAWPFGWRSAGFRMVTFWNRNVIKSKLPWLKDVSYSGRVNFGWFKSTLGMNWDLPTLNENWSKANHGQFQFQFQFQFRVDGWVSLRLNTSGTDAWSLRRRLSDSCTFAEWHCTDSAAGIMTMHLYRLRWQFDWDWAFLLWKSAMFDGCGSDDDGVLCGDSIRFVYPSSSSSSSSLSIDDWEEETQSVGGFSNDWQFGEFNCDSRVLERFRGQFQTMLKSVQNNTKSIENFVYLKGCNGTRMAIGNFMIWIGLRTWRFITKSECWTQRDSLSHHVTPWGHALPTRPMDNVRWWHANRLSNCDFIVCATAASRVFVLFVESEKQVFLHKLHSTHSSIKHWKTQIWMHSIFISLPSICMQYANTLPALHGVFSRSFHPTKHMRRVSGEIQTDSASWSQGSHVAISLGIRCTRPLQQVAYRSILWDVDTNDRTGMDNDHDSMDPPPHPNVFGWKCGSHLSKSDKIKATQVPSTLSYNLLSCNPYFSIS
jgi:hypothetical protein